MPATAAAASPRRNQAASAAAGVALAAALWPFDRTHVQAATAPAASSVRRRGTAKRHNGSRKRSGSGGGGGGGGDGRPEGARLNETGHYDDTGGGGGAEDTDGNAEVVDAGTDIAAVRSDRTHDGVGTGDDEAEAATDHQGESDGGAAAQARPQAAAGAEAAVMMKKKKKARGAAKHSSSSREATQRREEVTRNSQDEKPNDHGDDGTPREEHGGGGGNRHETNATKERAQETGADGGSSSGGGGGGSHPGNISGNVGAAAAGAALAELRATDERGGDEPEVGVGVAGDVADEDQEGGEEEEEEKEECQATGPCVWCESTEASLEYCKETGRREEVRCTVKGAAQNMVTGGAGGVVGVLPNSVKYRSCAYAEEDDFLGLFHFWIVMVAVGVSACYGMKKRKKRRGVSRYDDRRAT